MPAIKTGKKTEKYTTEFKVKAVEWSHQAHRSVKSVAEALDIHPFMLSRWRKEHREGEFDAQNRDHKTGTDLFDWLWKPTTKASHTAKADQIWEAVTTGRLFTHAPRNRRVNAGGKSRDLHLSLPGY
ncbi:transposase [Marinobacter maritimus]|uniref:transposase n=1 Tax=Marinobacter maritimus TaxID=277961 RepID=UPI0011A9717D